MKKFFINLTILVLALMIIAGGILFGLMVSVRSEYDHKIYRDVQQLPEESAAVVLGASVYRDRTPSDALEDRLDAAVRAWRADKAEIIILSGDDGRYAQEEVQSMLNYLVNRGIPRDKIVIDGNNARTFDSCYRLKNELNRNEVVLITQEFHLPRALYLCNKMGLDAWGLPADQRLYRDIVWFTIRDWLASALAYWDIRYQRLPTYLESANQ